MKNYKFHLKFFILAISNISLFLAGTFFLFVNRLDLKGLWDLILNNTIILLPITLLYAYFEKWGWKQSMWRWARPLLRFPPDLSGRWEGTLYRVTDELEEGFVIEIEQTMTKLQVYTYSQRNSESVSILDEIACDIQHEKNFVLCYLWEGRAKNLPGQAADSGKFSGYTMLKYIETKSGKELDGEYFTDRKPTQTQGLIKVKWVSNELKKKFS